MYSFIFTNKFKKDFELLKKRNFEMKFIETVLKHLQEKGTVPAVYKPHKLYGNYNDCFECHIKPDWLLIWTYNSQTEVSLIRTGTHSDLF